MKKIIILSLLIGLVLIGCHQNVLNSNREVPNLSTNKIYKDSWDGNPIVVIQGDKNESIKTIHDASHIKKLIHEIKSADWQENVDVDIRPADYHFKWNSYTHNVWINEETNKLELNIEGKSNYGVLSSNSSEIVFEILTHNTF